MRMHRLPSSTPPAIDQPPISNGSPRKIARPHRTVPGMTLRHSRPPGSGSHVWRTRLRGLLVAALGVAALIGGFVLLPLTADVPADGPYRAMLAYNWYRNPHLSVCGSWLPGPMYLNGLFFWIVSDPLVSTRIFNVIAGGIAIPVFFLLWERIFAPPIAALAAVALACLPLRIGLSASSMTEPAFLLALGSGTWFLLAASEFHRPRATYLVPALTLLSLAALCRYEAWLLLPFFPTFYYLRTRRLAETLAVAGLLAAVPTAWMFGNLYCFGDALKGFRAATTEERYAETVDLIGALRLLGSMLFQQAGALITSGIVIGGALCLFAACRTTHRIRARPEYLLYGALLIATWLVLIKFAMARGPASFQSRYVVLALVLALPLSVVPLMPLLRKRPGTGVIVGIAFAASLAMSGREISARWLPDIWLVARQPGDFIDDMTDVAHWLRISGHSQGALLSTPINIKYGWATNYLPLLLPEASNRIRTMSYWLSDADIRTFMRDYRPSLLIAGFGEIDREETARFERLAGRALSAEDVVFRSFGNTPVTIYRIAEPD